MEQMELAQEVDDTRRGRSRSGSARIELAGDENFTVECKPEGGDSWDEEKIGGGAKDQLRCRFTKNGKTVEFPVLPGDDKALRCLCNAQAYDDGTKVSLILANGEELTCERLPGAADAMTEVSAEGVMMKIELLHYFAHLDLVATFATRREIIWVASSAAPTYRKNFESLDSVPREDLDLSLLAGEIYKQLSILDRFLFVWIFAVMGLALLVGYYVTSIKSRLSVVKIASVSLPIAIGLWVMMYPVLCKVKYELLYKMLKSGNLGKNLLLSLGMNWVVGPALMTGLAWATLPDLPHYRTGVILIGIARCIAMVLIWNELAKGDSQLCAILVAVNSVLQIALFTPVSLFYLKVVSGGHGVDVGAWTVAKSVLLFLGVPLAAGFSTRFILRRAAGSRWYDTKFLPFIGPWALIGLLYTVFVMFSIQAHQIVHNIGNVARVIVPMLLYFSVTFASSLAVCRYLRLPYSQLVTQSFTAASNNFELAIAVAVGAFGIDSQEALAATIGPLIEVPVLLVLVYVTLYFRKWLSPKV